MWVNDKREAQKSGFLLNEFKNMADSARRRVEEIGAIHCMYLFKEDEIWRWTSNSGDIRRDVLDVSTDEVKKLANRTWEMMSSKCNKRNEEISKASLRDLHKLAKSLLPEEVLSTSANEKKKLLLITPDDILSKIPFETFNIGRRDRYIPLLSTHDVAYLRDMEPAPDGMGSDPGIVLVNADISKELDRRYIFQRELSQTQIEVDAIAAIDPNICCLQNADASKSNLMSFWENASFIYFASHIFRNPEVPYLMLIPLAPPKTLAGPHASYLDVTDVRSADLSKCNLVVLSGCSSGAPYVDENAVGPSLGDAFLDAGAAAVVQTFWDVRDDNASKLMKSYISSWKDPDFEKIHSLCEIRRKALQSPKGPRHPSTWAAYAIKIGKF
jgi:CHAT domain-containing protein